ncbi:MAG: RNA-protein complex protein Nop10 [Candidatus Geothermarchaeota archaeon]
MRFKIKKCPNCNTYTLKATCPHCGAKTIIAHPAKFSPDDRYLLYKIKAIEYSKTHETTL